MLPVVYVAESRNASNGLVIPYLAVERQYVRPLGSVG